MIQEPYDTIFSYKKTRRSIQMVRRLFLFAGILVLVAPFAWSQDEYKIELTPFIGYSFSEGVDITPTNIGGGEVVNRISPTSGLSYGFTVDWLASENFAIGFNFNQQDSNLEGRFQQSGKRNFVDMKVRNYHGIFTYNVGYEDAPMRPFFFGGLGATQYAPGSIEGNSSDSSTRFSTTWGGGVKFFVSENIGIKGTGRWTPTYIKSDPAGVWCNPWYPWSCWVVGEANYSHQFEMSAGVTFRF
jgi:opacity protein-like surface antigen